MFTFTLIGCYANFQTDLYTTYLNTERTTSSRSFIYTKTCHPFSLRSSDNWLKLTKIIKDNHVLKIQYSFSCKETTCTVY